MCCIIDITGACKSARIKVADKYKELFSVNEQAHVTDLLLEHIANLEWVSLVIKEVSSITIYLDALPKLRKRFKEIMHQ